MGQHFLQHLRAFLGEDLDPLGLLDAPRADDWAVPARVGLGFVPPLANAAFDGAARPVTVPPVGEPAYIAALLVADPDALARPVAGGAGARSCTRCCATRSCASTPRRRRGCSTSTGQRPRAGARSRARRPRARAPPAETWPRQRERPVGGAAVRDRLADGTPSRGSPRSGRRSARLAATDAATLERHLGGTPRRHLAPARRLDHLARDAAAARTARGVARGRRDRRLRLGREPAAGAPGPRSDAAARRARAARRRCRRDPGFIHAPSLNQASAAALLRNAHLAHGGSPASPYAIDLSSARVRLAKRLFEGIRQGQPLGALLGYDFERGLHEAGLDDADRRLPPAGAAARGRDADRRAPARRRRAGAVAPLGLGPRAAC